MARQECTPLLVMDHKGRGSHLAPRLVRRLLPCNRVGDGLYATLLHLYFHRRIPGRKDSGRHNDRLFWSKFDGTLLDPLCQYVTDKVYVKQYIAAIVGEQHTMATCHVLRSEEEVRRLELKHFPCVIKPTHLSGALAICRGPETVPDPRLLEGWLRRNFYLETREQNYRYLRPGIIVEEYLEAEGRLVPTDYKVYCIDGTPRVIEVICGRYEQQTTDYYNTAWQRLPFYDEVPPGADGVPRPPCLEKMLEISVQLSAPFAFIRVDMYARGEDIRVGELTNCNASACSRIRPLEGEYILEGRLPPRRRGS